MYFFKLNRKRQFVMKMNKRTKLPIQKRQSSNILKSANQMLICNRKSKKETYKMGYCTELK